MTQFLFSCLLLTRDNKHSVLQNFFLCKRRVNPVLTSEPWPSKSYVGCESSHAAKQIFSKWFTLYRRVTPFMEYILFEYENMTVKRPSPSLLLNNSLVVGRNNRKWKFHMKRICLLYNLIQKHDCEQHNSTLFKATMNSSHFFTREILEQIKLITNFPRFINHNGSSTIESKKGLRVVELYSVHFSGIKINVRAGEEKRLKNLTHSHTHIHAHVYTQRP